MNFRNKNLQNDISIMNHYYTEDRLFVWQMILSIYAKCCLCSCLMNEFASDILQIMSLRMIMCTILLKSYEKKEEE
ncbi:hypothetical protein DERP_010510 [Dermatophagoides pteronyssinus]|uniref:Uncharacterized protein n=1 Tax=Dermatophagoides pteronyssinus TaxID=6956 RepID=A0ABQ8JFK3_DERPT|nr:hypothetical protein DERP_010510 [Dermatophagoides pteronyssinus]